MTLIFCRERVGDFTEKNIENKELVDRRLQKNTLPQLVDI